MPREKKNNTVEVSEGKCATVDFGKHFRLLPKKRIFSGNADKTNYILLCCKLDML